MTMDHMPTSGLFRSPHHSCTPRGFYDNTSCLSRELVHELVMTDIKFTNLRHWLIKRQRIMIPGKVQSTVSAFLTFHLLEA
ncbi:hypothetical protein HZ326_6901 [Fusarium oxysporum f. sp. albedinis]|nr:hypothetical protein HZ326_6901 [Fusarium oxysporum f. sp. albedinis]